jgi:hypothetical protein
MTKRNRILAGALLAGVTAFAVTTPAWTQGNSGPVARYTIDAGTISGMGAMGAGGGGVGAALGALGGGGSQVAHELFLRLGSSRAADGEARGDHFMPEGARLGRSVPLQTPRVVDDTGEDYLPRTGPTQMPEGRLLLFWGCGEKAGPGQPVVIDFSKMARGEVPPGLFAAMNDLPEAWRVHGGNSRTYGEWPNSLDDKRVQPNASLLGAHRISSSYSPDIAFTLAHDFMPALRPVTRDLPGGAVSLSWNALDQATGYYAWVMATGADGGNSRDMVWWSSSATQQFGGPMSDWLSPAAVRRLVDDKTVMPASQTTCAIPAEVKAAGGPMLMTQLFAYGPQADFSYPERPRAAPASWSPEWIARVRFRANAMVMHGLPGMESFEGGSGSESDAGEAAPAVPALPRCRGGLRGIAERAAGLCQ